MESKIERELRWLKAYAAVSAIFFGILTLAAFQTSHKTKFDEIDVERINIVENGKLRMTISNNQRSPGEIIGGHTMKSREGHRGAGLIFFNDNGDECGGMTWSGKEENGKVEADSGVLFDQYNQDQTVGITYRQNGPNRMSGLQVWERPLMPISDLAQKVGALELHPDSPQKAAALKQLQEEAVKSGVIGVQRVFVGRNQKNDATVTLMDTKGKPRIVMAVDSQNNPSLQFLDENGKTTYSLPEQKSPGR
ncbi:MAG TPA: hypothetical protein VFQ00_12385 [Terriglobales bacterium]|nr:hypothetical protein [Terriglobales bacterium]